MNLIQHPTYADAEDWLEQLESEYNKFKRTGWTFIIILAAGINQFGRNNDAKKAELYDWAADSLETEPKTLHNYVSLLQKPSTQEAIKLGLGFGHANAVLGLNDEHAAGLLTIAANERWSVRRLEYMARPLKPKSNGTRKEASPHVRTSSTEAPATLFLTMGDAPTDEPEPEAAPTPVSPAARDGLMDAARAIEKVNYSRWITTRGLAVLAPMNDIDGLTLSIYLRIMEDLTAWCFADYMNRVQQQIKRKNLYGAEHEAETQHRYAIVQELYPERTRADMEHAALTAWLWPADERRQSQYVHYGHHVALNTRSREERAMYLDKVEAKGWSVEQLQNELRGKP